MRYNNYHKHTHYSNIRTIDSITKPEAYMKRAVELGHTTYFTTEHGFQGNIYEACTLCEKYGLKCIYGVEAYYTDDMNDKSNRSAYHIMLIAMTERARKEINKIMSIANQDGFYYKPRIDLKCLLSLTPTDTIITSACVAGRLFKGDNWLNDFFIPVYKHFGKNFMLEVQDHNEQIQKEWNKNILQLKDQYELSIIHGCDSHYILPEESKYRDMFLRAKGIFYEEESGFILDYPDDKTIAKRYLEQGVLSKEDIIEALKNTQIFDNAEGIKLDKEFKIPVIKKEIIEKELDIKDTTDENKILKMIVSKAWNKEKKNIDQNRIKEYEQAIYDEINTVEKCGMARYFIIDNIIVNKAVKEYGAILTKSGRGSAVSFYINKLLGLTEIDRLAAPITLYPSRFMSAERILNSRSLPDIDLNFASVKPVIQASKDILGENGVYYMVAYKPLQDSSAFRLWCKAKGYNIDEYNEVAKNLEDYLEDKRWMDIIEESKIFRGVIESIAPSPCSFLLLDKPIPEEVGLIRVGNSQKYTICCCMDGYNCDVYKYLKNDYLQVTVYQIISEVYNLINQPIDNIKELLKKCDDKVWNLYEKGLTTTINQADSDFDKQILKRYKPKNLAELSAYVAAIRPGFASLLNTFVNREEYTTGVKELDDLLSDSFHFMMYQESIMKYLIWLGIEEKETYDIIKKIAKKKFKEEELITLKETLKKSWVEKIGNSEEDNKHFENTWQVVQDAAKYSFNASHSLSVAIDSLYGAYLKSHYQLEYFTVVLSLYADDMERTAKLINELDYFNIKILPIKFGKSAGKYTIDKKNNAIYKGIGSIKYCNEQIADELLALSNNYYNSFFELLDDISEKTSIDNRQLNILTGLNFFSDFGNNKYLLKLIILYYGIKKKVDGAKSAKTILPSIRTCKQLKKDKIEESPEYAEYGITPQIVMKYAGKETAKQYSNIDNIGLLNELASNIDNKSMSVIEQCKFEKEYLEYVTYINPEIEDCYYIVIEYKTFKDSSKPYVTLRKLKTGEEINTKIKQGNVYKQNPFGLFSVLKVEEFEWCNKSKLIDGEWTKTEETEPVLKQYEVMKNYKGDNN